VVKIIWHQAHRRRRRMVQSYSQGGGNVSSHDGTLALPCECDWTCAFFGPLESTTQMANRSVQPFSTAHGRKCLYFTMGAPIHQNCPFPWEIWTPSNIWCVRPMRAHNTNSTSISSAVFAQMTKVVVERCGLHPRPWTIVA